jgi:hypothetical protein
MQSACGSKPASWRAAFAEPLYLCTTYAACGKCNKRTHCPTRSVLLCVRFWQHTGLSGICFSRAILASVIEEQQYLAQGLLTPWGDPALTLQARQRNECLKPHDLILRPVYMQVPPSPCCSSVPFSKNCTLHRLVMGDLLNSHPPHCPQNLLSESCSWPLWLARTVLHRSS